MLSLFKLLGLTLLFMSFDIQANQELKDLFAKEYKTKTERSILKSKTLALGSESTETLIEVMKTSSYPDDNRWFATYLLGQVMGSDAAPFIAKFLSHPSWFMRLASLKTLLLLKEDKYKSEYVKALKDSSMIVRAQALDNITEMKMVELAPTLWGMLYDETNYAGDSKDLKRTQMIKDVILAVGQLGFQKVKPAMLKMINDKAYVDLFSELDYSLVKLTGEKSPDHIGAKQIFWKKFALSQPQIH